MLSAHSKDHVDCVSRVLRNAARLPQAPVPTPILDSWRRSMEQHCLDPGSLQGPRILSQTLLDECRERSELFLRIASEEVARLHGRVRDADYCVLLTDAQGRTIDYRVESTIRNDCRKAGLYLGTCWSEGEEGTCGVAAVLTDRTAVTVHKRDHFRAAFIDLTCSAAPVFDPQGELLGVLDVSAVQSPDDRRSQHLIRQMVAQSAREIENAFFMHSAQGHWVLRAHRAPGYVDSQPDYLFAWDADGRLLALNPAARHYLRQRLGQVPSHIGEVFDLDALHAAADQAPCLLRGQAGELHVRLSAPRAKARRLEREVPDDAALDPRIAESLRLAVRVKDRNLPVLIQGETGAGKEVFARQLHQASARRDKPFVALNCAAIPESLIESELFGYVGGAFTGAAAKGMRGLLQQADGGTLFLDEIGDMPLGLQTRLLRVLAEGEVAPLGGCAPAGCGYPGDLRHPPRPGGAGGGRRLPRGSLLPPRRRPLRTAAATRTQRPAGADPAHPRRGNRALRRTHRTRRGSPGMPARLSLAGQCPPVAACVALRLRAVRRRHPATRRPSGRAAWRRPDTGQCVRERRRSGARRPARRPRAASLETHGRGAGTGYLASDPVSAGAPAWHPHAGPGGRLRCAGGRRSRQARKIKTSLEPCPVNAGGLSL